MRCCAHSAQAESGGGSWPFRESPEAALRTSASVAIAQTAEAFAQRRLTGDWLAAVVGRAVPDCAAAPQPPRLPASSDGAFRAALRDGVLLCRLANALRPGVVPKARERALQQSRVTHRALLPAALRLSRRWRGTRR
jgi:hypothetical protein